MLKHKIRAAGNYFRRSPRLFNLLKRVYGVFPRALRSSDTIPFLLEKLGGEVKDGLFVQIGSNDGVADDPLSAFIEKHQWRGLCIEPSPAIFQRLCANRRKLRNVKFDCVAVGKTDGELEFFVVDTQNHQSLPPIVDQFGSFDRNMVLKNLCEWNVPDPESKIATLKVPVLSLASLLRKHDIRQIDLLHIDAEGYDFQILQQVDFAGAPPRLIMFEHSHMSEAELAECARLLKSYSLVRERYDMIATRIDTAK